MSVVGLDHVQIAIPAGAEDRARRFYGDLLGMRELPKPMPLAARGGAWFQCGNLQLHVGVEQDFHPARKAHPAFRVSALGALRDRLADAGHVIRENHELPELERFFTDDPFGNRVELIQDPASPTE